MKILRRLALALFGLLIAILVAFYVYIDVIAGSAIERGATYALGVDTKVGFVRVAPLRGFFRIGSLQVRNPPGFDKKHLLTLGDARLEVDTGSLRGDVVEVPNFTLEDVDVALEKEGGSTNYGTVLKNLKRFEKGGSKQPKPEPGESGSGKRFIVRELLIRDISAHLAHNEALGIVGGIDVAVPEIRLRDVGAHNARGVAMAELTNIIMKAIFEGIATHGTNLPSLISGDLRSSMSGLSRVPVQFLGGATGAVIEPLPEPVGEAVRSLGGEAGKALEKGLGGLLGGKEKE